MNIDWNILKMSLNKGNLVVSVLVGLFDATLIMAGATALAKFLIPDIEFTAGGVFMLVCIALTIFVSITLLAYRILQLR